ncbi:TonB-dependent receptor [Denitratisoma sp. agr-D3]
MGKKWQLRKLAWLGMCSVFGAWAQESTTVLGEVSVVAPNDGPLPASRILTSVDVMGAEHIREKNVTNSWELMGQMPGVQLTEFRMGAESGKPSFRAFNGEGYINGIKLLIDGVPSNISTGNLRYMDMVFPADIDYIEVVRGTNDPRYGLHNIGGNINVATRQGGNYTEGRFSAGSFNTQEVQATLGRENDGFAQNYFLAIEDSDGYRAHSKSEKYGVGGKWFFTPSSDLKFGVIARSYRNTAQEAGYLTAGELAADRWQSPAKNANDHDVRDMQHLSGHLDYRLNANTTFSSKLYYNTIDDDRFLTYTSAVTNSARQHRHWIEDHTGWLNSVTWVASDALVLDGGFNLEHQANRYQRYRFAAATPTDFSTPASTSNDDDYTLNNFGAYVQAIIKPAKDWKIVPAFRVDRFTGHLSQHTTGAEAPLQDYGWIKQPKLSVVYSVAPAASLYANWGRTFQVVTGSSGGYLTAGTANYQPSINTGYELGTKFKIAQNAEMRVAAWQQDATREIANLPAASTIIDMGKTHRKGVDLQLSARLSDRFNFWVSHSIQEAKIESGVVDGVSMAGKEVFATPRYISNVGAEYQASEQWRLGMQGRAQGSYYIDNANALGKFGGIVLFDASVRYDYSKTVSVDFQVKNLLDRKYEYVYYENFNWSGNNQPMFSPGAGRSAYLSLNLKY